MVEKVFKGLNTKQTEAVSNTSQILRIIAGAGCGKTRVLVRKIEWFLQQQNLRPDQIIALTFTNKAAKEMRERLENALEQRLNKLWVGTFHSICHRILRQYATKIGWQVDFSILDSDDQIRFIKSLMKAEKFDENICSPQKMAWQINQLKEKGLRAENVSLLEVQNEPKILAFYALYEKACQQQAAMDFSELLLLTLELLQKNTDARERLRKRFRAILVDEFQDTNTLQYQIIKALMTSETALFVVGDDDQSIYGWRGAKIEHILQLEKDFPTLKTIRLEQNYRSSEKILQAANAMIAHNNNRLEKHLWTATKGGENIAVFAAANEAEEAQFIFRQLKKWQATGGKLSDCAILYRSNAQSRILETIFLQNKMPFRIFGGLRFFARAEIKDALAYLRLCQFPTDDHALRRIINQPARGIGEKTLAKLQQTAQKLQLSLWQTINNPTLLNTYFTGRVRSVLTHFVDLIKEMQRKINDKEKLSQVMCVVVYDSGLFQKYQQEGTKKALERCQNLKELIQSAIDQEEGSLNAQIETFLTNAVLDTGEDHPQQDIDFVQMMTLHSAKGLEFENVFIVGFEEGLFPINFNQDIEEERRLAYVGITRAKSKLTLSFAENRRTYEDVKKIVPSRFLAEIPENILSFLRFPVSFFSQSKYQDQTIKSTQDGTGTTLAGFSIGEKVSHNRFGIGKIKYFEGTGRHARAAIEFPEGKKILVLAYANLQKLL